MLLKKNNIIVPIIFKDEFMKYTEDSIKFICSSLEYYVTIFDKFMNNGLTKEEHDECSKLSDDINNKVANMGNVFDNYYKNITNTIRKIVPNSLMGIYDKKDLTQININSYNNFKNKIIKELKDQMLLVRQKYKNTREYFPSMSLENKTYWNNLVFHKIFRTEDIINAEILLLIEFSFEYIEKRNNEMEK